MSLIKSDRLLLNITTLAFCMSLFAYIPFFTNAYSDRVKTEMHIKVAQLLVEKALSGEKDLEKMAEERGLRWTTDSKMSSLSFDVEYEQNCRFAAEEALKYFPHVSIDGQPVTGRTSIVPACDTFSKTRISVSMPLSADLSNTEATADDQMKAEAALIHAQIYSDIYSEMCSTIEPEVERFYGHNQTNGGSLPASVLDSFALMFKHWVATATNLS